MQARAFLGDVNTFAAGLLRRAVDCRHRMTDVLGTVADVVNRLHEFEDARPWQRLTHEARAQWAQCWQHVVAVGDTDSWKVACQPTADAGGIAAGTTTTTLWGPVPDSATVTSWLHTLEHGVTLYRDLDHCRALAECSEGDRDALDAEYEALEDLAGRLEHALAVEECLVISIKAQVCAAPDDP